MSFYQDYKPLRNYLRRFQTLPSLRVLWAYARHVFDGESLPPGLPRGLPLTLSPPERAHCYPWELEILVREILLQAAPGAGALDLGQWTALATALHHRRRLEDGLAAHTDGPALLLELNRMAYRQFRWQERQDLAWIARVGKIYGTELIDAVVRSELGMSTPQFVQFGAHIAGHFIARWDLSTARDCAVRGIRREAAGSLFEPLTCDLCRPRGLHCGGFRGHALDSHA